MADLIAQWQTSMAGRILLAALFLGIVFDAIFYGEPLGVSLPLFVGLLLFALEGLGRSKGLRAAGRFAIGAFVAALGFLVSLNALNPAAFIVRQDLARRQETGRLGALYLACLASEHTARLPGPGRRWLVGCLPTPCRGGAMMGRPWSAAQLPK